MTIGIYALYWEDQNLIYIGQSQNIEHRYHDHISSMTSYKHTNYKVQNTYNLYGEPTCVILNICCIYELDELEIYWTKEFNSIVQGLNIIEPGIGAGYGTNHSNSKYTKFQILQVFRHLYLTIYKGIPIVSLAKKLNVNESLISDIKCGFRHIWLRDKYPHQYKLMNLLDRADGRGGKWAYNPEHGVILSPTGELHYIHNVNSFAKKYRLDQSALCKVLNGDRAHHMGWKIP